MRSSRPLALIAGLAAVLAAGFILRTSPAIAVAAPAPSHQAEQRFASINAFQAVEKMVQSDRYRPARETLMNDLKMRLEVPQNEIASIAKEIMAAGQDSDRGRSLMPTYQNKNRELQQLRQELEEKAGEFNTQQLAEAYRLVVETADKIASDRGYTHVIATRGLANEPLKSTNVAAAVQEILARPLVRFPAGDDLTDAVMKELKIDAVVTEPAAPTEVVPPAPGVAPK